MKYFTLQELTKTSVKADNTPNSEHILNLENLVDKILDPLREIYDKPIYVNSGYRSPEVNMAIGGVNNSQHMKGEAADITAGSSQENRRLFQMIANGGYEFDQLIDERGYRWIHVSLKRIGYNRKQILHLS